MKKDKIIFWGTTLIIAGAMLISGVVDILQPDGFAEDIASLGYPLYFFKILGVFKIIGSLLLIIPKVSLKLKELAYAGFLFDFVYAALSHAVIEEYTKIVPPIIFLIILRISFQYKNKITNNDSSSI